MYVAGVLAKIAKDIPKRILPKMSRNKSFYWIARFEAIYSASKTRVLVLKYTTIGNRLLIYEFVNIGACLETSMWWLVLRQSNSFQDPKAISQLNFEHLSNLPIFVGFIWLIKVDTWNFSQKCQQIFLPDALFFEQ